MDSSSNVIFGAPQRVIAAGTSKNLVQAAIMSKTPVTAEELDRLRRTLEFGSGGRIIVVPTTTPTTITTERQIAQGSIGFSPSVSLKDIDELEKTLAFSAGSKRKIA